MDKASVTSPIDFLKNTLRLFMGSMGGAILENLGIYKIQLFKKNTRVVWCVVSDHGRDHGRSAYPIISCQSKLTALILSHIL